MPIKLAECCTPLLGEKIVGILVEGKGINVHLINCSTLDRFSDFPELWFELMWDKNAGKFPQISKINITIQNKVGSFHKVTSCIKKANANIVDLNIPAIFNTQSLVQFIHRSLAYIISFYVLFLGISLGHKIAIATVGLYLIEGIAGLPVFSNSPEKGVGLMYFTGPTMGYLIGFLTACYLASKIKVSDNFFVILFKLIIATSTIYILGLIWLGTLIGWDKPIFALGAKPFLLAEIFKITILALLTKQIIKIKKII